MPSLLVSTLKLVSVMTPSPDINPESMTLPVLTVSSGVLAVSLLSVKRSLTGVTVMFNVDVSDIPYPSNRL